MLWLSSVLIIFYVKLSNTVKFSVKMITINVFFILFVLVTSLTYDKSLLYK